jgi:hypothetical protein
MKVNKLFEILRAIPMFSECESSFLRELCVKFESVVVPSKHLICEHIAKNRDMEDKDSVSQGLLQCTKVGVDHNENDDIDEDEVPFRPTGMYIVASGVVNIVEYGHRNIIQKHKGEYFAASFLFDIKDMRQSFRVTATYASLILVLSCKFVVC